MYNQLSVRERSTFTQIAIYCNDDGYPFYSMNKIADQIGQTSGHFSRDAKKLFELGLLVKDGRSFRVSDMCIGKVRHRISAKMLNGRYTVVDEVSHEYSDTLPQMEETATKVVAPSEGGCYQGGSSGCYQDGSSAATKVVAPVPYNRKEEKNKKETILNGLSDGQLAHLGYAMSAKPYRGGGRPADASQMEQPSRVQVVKAQPQPTWWEQRANMKSFAERIEEQKQAYLSSKPKYTKEQEAFLDVYPKGTMDPAAFMAAWEMVIEQDVLPQELIDAARIAAASQAFKKEEGLYIPKPENWLMSKGWASYVEPRRSKRRQKRREESNREPTQDEIDAFIKQQLEEQERAMKEQNNGGNV